MSTYPDDRPATGDDSSTVTSAGNGSLTTRGEPLAADGRPIFPPIGDTDPGAAREADLDAGLLDAGPEPDTETTPGPATGATALEPDSAGYAPDSAGYPSDSAGYIPDSVDEPVAAGPTAEPAHRVDDHDQAWLDLQGTFVDDPAAAVRQAGERVERELAGFRERLDSADTEALRTAFRQFRDLSAILR